MGRVTMETVAFYSYKGGVGRTLLVANTAQFLAMSGRRVVALDLDLEAPGLHQKLGSHEVILSAREGTLRGAVDELLKNLGHEPRSGGLADAAVEVQLPSGTRGSLILIPAGASPSQAYWTALERLTHSLRADRRHGGLPEAVLELQARIAEELSPDFLLVDSRTGITELGGLATSLLADRVVCLTSSAPESVEGTLVVAAALRTAARLPSQAPVRLDFVITRVASRHDPHVLPLIEQLGGAAAVLPQDRAIASEEHVFANWRAGRSAKGDGGAASGQELFPATLDWIASSFPGHQRDAEKARHRMQAVHSAWQSLTRTDQQVRGGTRALPAWPVDQLRERVRFAKAKTSRLADIVAYDSPSESARPLMVIEYLDGEDRDGVAQWWLRETDAQLVAVLSESDHWLYSRKSAWSTRPRPSERWDLPLPHDFQALADPADASVDALLEAVRRGFPQYLERLVTEWVRSSAVTLHGGAPWRPQIAKKILDGLARVDDVDLAKRVLWAASADARYRGMWLGDFDDWLDEQVLAELFAPLLWRLPPEASVSLMSDHGRFGPPTGRVAIGLLARDVLGLKYDPDATFRIDAQRILDRTGRDREAGDDEGVHALARAFKKTEITFEISAEAPPLARIETNERKKRRGMEDLGTLVTERVAASSLITTGLLGDYLPHLGKVILYSEAIAQCADKLSLRARHVGSITLIHETLHALAHLGRDLDGRHWQEFALPSPTTLLFEPSWFHEGLTQYFTHLHLVRLQDPVLLNAFEVLSSRQAPAYRAWQRLRHLPCEDVRTWFMSVRRGVGAAGPPTQLLFDASQREDG